MPLPLKRASVFADGLDHPECVAYHPDGTFYAGGEAGQIYRISADGKRVEEIARSDGGFILGVAISPDGTWLAACDLRKKVVWRLDLNGRTLQEFAGGFSIPNHLAFTTDGTPVFVEAKVITPSAAPTRSSTASPSPTTRDPTPPPDTHPIEVWVPTPH